MVNYLPFPMSTLSFSSIILILLTAAILARTSQAAPPHGGGQWTLLQKSLGISPMHMQLLNNDRVIMYDRTNFGKSQINLPNGKCRNNDMFIKPDCTAHSVEYNTLTNTFRPLMIQTDTWCSSGAVTSQGDLVQTGGSEEGQRVVRLFKPCSSNSCDWKELGNKLNVQRWYASNHILPDGQIIIIGGREQFNYEFYPRNTGLHELPFLKETRGEGVGNYNNIYPFVFLTPDDKLFIFANNRAVLHDYKTNKVLRTYPTIPGDQPRNYPSTGSAVLLPLTNINSNTAVQAEFMVCGGAPKDSFQQANKGKFITALQDCGRLKITDPNPKWAMETMPIPRVMGDMLILPNADILIINGCKRGTAGWGLCRDGVRTPVLYRPNAKPGTRFEIQTGSNTPRVYHSTAIVTRTGEILVAGSNTFFGYEFGDKALFPTDLSLQKYMPWYVFSDHRPHIQEPKNSHITATYNKKVHITFSVSGETPPVKVEDVKVNILLPPFNSHSFSQSQRMLQLPIVIWKIVGGENKRHFRVTVRMPNSDALAPPMYYMLFLVYKDVPTLGKWVRLRR